jgi:hypothetical protein
MVTGRQTSHDLPGFVEEKRRLSFTEKPSFCQFFLCFLPTHAHKDEEKKGMSGAIKKGF